jgi:putative DNA primase/helicase
MCDQRRRKADVETAEARPEYLPTCPDGIPAELKERKQWVHWRAEWREEKGGDKGKWSKVPMRRQKRASSTNPATWMGFDFALKGYRELALDGLGFVFADEDPFVGVDLDDCRDPATGQLDEWGARIVAALDSYTEVSPSGTGLKVWLRGKKPLGPCKVRHETGEVEVYDRGRYFAVTGRRHDGAPATVNERGEQLAVVYRQVFGEYRETSGGQHRNGRAEGTNDVKTGQRVTKLKARRRPPDGAWSDEDFLRFVAEGYDKKLTAMWGGDTSGHGDDDSRADVALCEKIAYYIGGLDEARVDRLFRQSGLYRDKWDREGYRRRTFDYLAGVMTEFRTPKESRSFTFGPLALEPGRARRTDSGKLTVSVAVTRSDGKKEPLSVTDVLSNRERAAARLVTLAGEGAPSHEEAMDTLADVLTYAAEQLDNREETADGPTVAEVVTAEVPKALGVVCRTRKGVWSEARRAELSRTDFIAYTPESLIEQAGRGVDAPKGGDGRPLRYDVRLAIENELKILHPSLLASLPLMHESPLAADSAAASVFRAGLLRLWTELCTAITSRQEGGEPVQVKASLIQRVREAISRRRQANAPPSEGWQEVHGSMKAWWRSGAARDGRQAVWLGMRWELMHQARVELLGVESQATLQALGALFGCFDPNPPVCREFDDTAEPLAVLSQALSAELLATPMNDWPSPERPEEAGARP